MANPTSNFGWQMPQNTDLVKDLPADFEVFGQAVDTSLMDLKGGTTGQVLSKASNTDMDFTWVAQDDSNAIQNAIVDAKGDLISATAADTPARLASSGVNGDVLQVDTSTATGLKWGALAAGGMTSIASGTLSGSSVSITSIPSTYIELFLMITNRVHGTANKAAAIQLNADTGTNYTTSVTYGNNNAAGIATPDTAYIRTAGDAPTSGSVYSIETIRIPKYTDTSIHKIAIIESYQSATSIRHSIGFWKNTAAISSIQIMAESGVTLSSGNYVLYGVK